MTEEKIPRSKYQFEHIDVSSRCLSRRDFILAGSGAIIGAALPLGCTGDKENAKGNAEEDAKAVGTPWENTNRSICLLESVHLADINHLGEFIDFGTAARFKYTLGGWMCGWGSDISMNGMAYTWASESPSRVYFTVAEPVPLSFVIRSKPGGIDSFSVYLNDKPISRVTYAGSDWQEHRVNAAAEMVVQGENHLKFIYKNSEKKIGGAPASFAIDYLRIIAQGEEPEGNATFDPPHLDGLKQQFKAGDVERESLMLCLPTTLSYYAEIPLGAKLCMAAAVVPSTTQEKVPQASLSVRVTPVDAGESKELFSKKYSDLSWNLEMMDLSQYSGRLAKIDIIAKDAKGGRIAIADPAIRVTPPKIESSTSKAKNAIVLLIDTLRADKLTAYAKSRVMTPAFDKFIKESTLFEQCQAEANWTKPSCATVLTGLYPDTHKARGHSSKLGSTVKLASEIFSQAGFATGAFIANGYLAAEFGFNRGWNEYVNFIRENKPTEAEHVFKRSLEFISKNKDKPFFAYIQTIDPHVPYDPPDEDLKRYDAMPYDGPVQNRTTGNLLEEIKRNKVILNDRDKAHLEALYDGEITYHDRYFGHFLDELNKLGLLNNTAIFVCSDHGEEFFDHGSVGHGHTLYQELLHVPLVMRAPGIIPSNKRLRSEVGLADVLPTLLAATGVPEQAGLEGKNLLPRIWGEPASPIDATFSSFFSEADDRNLSWVARKGQFKLYMRGPARTFLYNLKNDPREQNDVDAKYPLAVRALRIALGQFIAAPDKRNWTSGQIAAALAGAPEANTEKAEMPEDLKQQLKALGYLQ